MNRDEENPNANECELNANANDNEVNDDNDTNDNANNNTNELNANIYLRNALIYKWIHRLILFVLSFASLYFGADTMNVSDSNSIGLFIDTTSSAYRNKVYLITIAFVIAFLFISRLDKRATVHKYRHKKITKKIKINNQCNPK